MADVTVTPVTMTEGTKSADLVGAGSAVTDAQTFAIAGGNVTHDLMIFMEEGGSGSATVTFDAGDNPPATRAGLGARAITLATSDLRAIVLESARHTQSDGTILGSVATQTVRIYALRIPKTV